MQHGKIKVLPVPNQNSKSAGFLLELNNLQHHQVPRHLKTAPFIVTHQKTTPLTVSPLLEHRLSFQPVKREQ